MTYKLFSNDFLIIFTCAAFFSFEAKALTLKEALQKAIHYHPQIVADRASADATKATIDQEYAGFYPTVDIAVWGGLSYVEENYKQNALQSPLKGESSGVTATPSLNLKQLLYNGELTASQVKKAIANFEQAYGQYLNTIDVRALKAAQAYIQVWQLQKIEALTQENKKIHERILRQITELVVHGELTEADRLQVQARLQDVNFSLALVQGQLEGVKADFREAIGCAPDRLSFAAVPAACIGRRLPGFLQEALRKNKSLQAAQADIQSSKARLDAAKANSLPVVTLEANANYDKNAAGVRGEDTRALALLVLRYNLTDGGADAARREEARGRVKESGEKLAVQRLALVQEVQTSWALRESAMQQLTYTLNAVREKKEIAKDYEKQFLVGIRSLLDILNAYRDLFDSHIQQVTSEAGVELTKARLLTASSSLLDAFKIPHP